MIGKINLVNNLTQEFLEYDCEIDTTINPCCVTLLNDDNDLYNLIIKNEVFNITVLDNDKNVIPVFCICKKNKKRNSGEKISL